MQCHKERKLHFSFSILDANWFLYTSFERKNIKIFYLKLKFKIYTRYIIFFFIFFSSLTSIFNLVDYNKLQIIYTYILWLGFIPFSYLFQLYLITIIVQFIIFRFNPPEFIQVTFYILLHFSFPILALFLLFFL